MPAAPLFPLSIRYSRNNLGNEVITGFPLLELAHHNRDNSEHRRTHKGKPKRDLFPVDMMKLGKINNPVIHFLITGLPSLSGGEAYRLTFPRDLKYARAD